MLLQLIEQLISIIDPQLQKQSLLRLSAVLYYAYGLIFNREKKSSLLSVSISLLVYTHVLTTLLCSALIACMIIVRLF